MESYQEGFEIERKYQISREVYDHFLAAFQDTSPIHVDREFARGRGYPDLVMHGNILNGFISHFIGVVYPGKDSLLQSVAIQYKSPNFLNDEILLRAKVTQVAEAVRVVVIDIELFNVTRNLLCATADVQVGIAQ